LNLGLPDWQIALAGAALLLAVGLIVAWIRRKPLDAEEIERRRRARLNLIGRIVEGQVLEIQESPLLPAPTAKRRKPEPLVAPAKAGGANGKRKLIVYSYSISGVTYETAQDVTGLEERACLGRIVSGLPVSVKYDPANPGNSILVADDWSGVH
jgi:hypothetical protein